MQMMDVIDNSLVSEDLLEKKYEDAPSTLVCLVKCIQYLLVKMH